MMRVLQNLWQKQINGTRQFNLVKEAKSMTVSSQHVPASHKQGFTLIELIVIVAITGIILGIGTINGRRTLQNSEENASINTIQQSIWQAATSASARGSIITLNRNGTDLTLNLPNGDIVRNFELSDSVSTNLPEGVVLTFLPPGEIQQSSYDNLSQPITITTSKGSHNLRVSLIGEVVVD